MPTDPSVYDPTFPASARLIIPPTYPVDARLTAGKLQRNLLPRAQQAELRSLEATPERNVLAVLGENNQGRIESLLPIRYGRMSASPWMFMRGAAAMMAHDLAQLPHSGIYTQLCGDCHLGNFGGFASPERALLFGINDFDETLPGPFEWDVKRLAASFVVVTREYGQKPEISARAAQAVACSYRERMQDYAQMDPLALWYQGIDVQALQHNTSNAVLRAQWQALFERATRRDATDVFDKSVAAARGEFRIIDRSPLIYHSEEVGVFAHKAAQFWAHYMESLPHERHILLARYTLCDVAMKVVGVGSVGTRCAMALLMDGRQSPLFLQFKEARPSILASYLEPSAYQNHGQRVVTGQRLMQAASDIFLGWTHVEALKTDFYIRQMHDMKTTMALDTLSGEAYIEYAEICGWALARAHAKAGDPALIAGYLGKSNRFDEAIGEFAHAYADRTQADHATFVAAIARGALPVQQES